MGFVNVYYLMTYRNAGSWQLMKCQVTHYVHQRWGDIGSKQENRGIVEKLF